MQLSSTSPRLPKLLWSKKFFILSVLVSLSGFIGFFAYIPSMYSLSYPIIPVALDMYLAMANGIFGLEALWWEYRYYTYRTRKDDNPIQTPPVRIQWFVYLLTVAGCIAVPLLFILYIIGYRVDAASWCIPLGIAFSIITYRMRTIYSSLFIRPEESSSHTENSTDSLLPSASINNSGNSVNPSSSSAPSVSLPVSWSRKIASYSHNLGWCIATLLLLLLLGGAGTIAYGWRTYLPRGKFYTLNLPLTSDPSTIVTQNIHVYCEGPYNKSLPTIFIECGGGGHSTSDMYGLMNYFSLVHQRRVCSYDFPGTGWSRLDVPLDDTVLLNNLPVYLVDAMETNEPSPYIMLGTMDDAPARAYTVALQRPKKVVGVVPMAYGYGEFLNLAAYHNWTPQQAASTISLTLMGRRTLGDIIRYLGIQWGVMQFLIGGGPSTYVPKNLEPEKNFLNLFHEGQWDMQVRILQSQVDDPINTVLVPDLWVTNRSLASTIPVLALGCFPTDLNQACIDAEYPLGSDNCRLYQFGITMDTEFMRNMTTMTPNSQFINFNYSSCSDSLVGSGSTITMVGDAVMNQFGNVYVTR